MKRIGIVVAMDSEYGLIESLLQEKNTRTSGKISFLEGKFADKVVILGRSGIGKVNSAIGAVELIKGYAPDGIINTGVAGGIASALNVMDIVVGEKMVYHDVWCGEGNQLGQIQGLPLYFYPDQRLYKTAVSIPGNIKGGLICSGDQFITNKAELQKIKTNFPEGLAVDMESCSIAQVCFLYDIPFLSFRIISDTPGVEGHAAQYKNFWKAAPERSFEVVKELIRLI